MAPPVKSTKPTPTPGKDIRAFFGSSQTRPSQSTAVSGLYSQRVSDANGRSDAFQTPKSTQGLKKGNAIEISESCLLIHILGHA